VVRSNLFGLVSLLLDLPSLATEKGQLRDRNFEEFVCDAYEFLMNYYHAGDRIYLFGFSRGAYTARALAGMIQRVSLGSWPYHTADSAGVPH
jgi:uncharacterized protein (DUF2235 family)